MGMFMGREGYTLECGLDRWDLGGLALGRGSSGASGILWSCARVSPER